MRPLKLVMTAFGPYCTRQEIDFSKLKDRNIFLVTGPTGAGKTTIFDGICYAVFGTGSGKDREGEDLRSDFANVEMTVVELTFELKGKKYYVKRMPKQLRKKSRGEGYTEQKADAELQLLDEDVPVVCGIRDVNEKINQILGLTYEQFRQIVMIPQGEFRELLLADSTDRETILQKIFGTEGFRKVQDILGDWAKDIKKMVEDCNSQRAENIRNFDVGEQETLTALMAAEHINIPLFLQAAQGFIDQDCQQEKELKQSIVRQEKLLTSKQEEFYRAQELKKKIELQEQLNLQYQQLASQQEEMTCRQERLTLARKANNLQGSEENYVSREKNAQQKEVMRSEIASKIVKEKRDLVLAKENVKKETDREEHRQQLMNQLVVLKGYKDKVQDLERRLQLEGEAAKKLQNKEQNIKLAKKRFEDLKKEVKDTNIALDKARQAAIEYLNFSGKLDSIKQLYSKLEKLQVENNQLQKIRQSYRQTSSLFKDSQLKWEQCQHNYLSLQELFFQGQAGILAGKLQSGKPCPVCGSTHHPHPAVLAVGMPTEEEFQTAELAVKEAEKTLQVSQVAFQEADSAGRAQKVIVDNYCDEIQELLGANITIDKDRLVEFIAEQLQSFHQQKSQLEETVKKLVVTKNAEVDLLKKIEANHELLEHIEQELETLNLEYMSLYAATESEKKLLHSLLKELPEHIRSHRALEQQIIIVEQKYEDMKRQLNVAQENFQACELSYEKSRTEQEIALKASMEANEEANIAKSKFMKELMLAGFIDIDTYRRAKLNDAQLTALEHEIRKYHETVRSVSDGVLQVASEIDGATLPDMVVLQAQQQAFQQKKEELQKLQIDVFARVKHNQGVLTNIYLIEERLGKKEQQYRSIGELANVARGFNSERITFERFVLAAFFSDIIIAANVRLTKMTGGRYELARRAEKGKGLTQSGLELEVFDNYTGRARHVKTLSGGESFKASLSLALGLADVVQSYAGGISLDTMFIDEGFGTLDPESLDNAIQCLLELQQGGRLVGIISHVPELKERIDARLEIEAGREGSIARFNIG